MTKQNTLHFAGSDWCVSADELSPELRQDLLECATPGQDASEAVDYVLAHYSVSGVPEDCAAMLRGYGAWDDEDLADHDENLRRLVWLAGCDLSEQGEAYFAEY